MPNLALNKPARQSSTCGWSRNPDPPQDAAGGNDGVLSVDYGFHTDTEAEPWWEVDLESECEIDSVVIYNRRTEAARLKHFSILTSRDGRSWTSIYRKTDAFVFGEGGDPFLADMDGRHLGRFVRIRLDGFNCLHFVECQVFGRPADAKARKRLLDEEAAREAARTAIPTARTGHVVEVGGFSVFVDTATYHPAVIEALHNGGYEHRERHLVSRFLRRGDRVIEAGTAAGIVTMTAAAIVGPANVWTFEANPDMVADARANFARNRLQDIRSHVGILRNARSIAAPGETVPFYIDQVFVASRLNASPQTPGIVRVVDVPVFSLEAAIADLDANVLVCDIEGGEVDLLSKADLSRIRLIIMETHYGAVGESETDGMIRILIEQGFSLDLAYSGDQVVVLRRS